MVSPSSLPTPSPRSSLRSLLANPGLGLNFILFLSIYASLLQPSDALKIDLLAAQSSRTDSSWNITVSWKIEHFLDPEQFTISGDGFDSQFVDTDGGLFGSVGMSAPELDPGWVYSRLYDLLMLMSLRRTYTLFATDIEFVFELLMSKRI
jgi:hypothetical protein